GEGRPVAVARGTLLERRLLERNRRTEILAERNARADPHTIQEGSSAAAAAADADLQGAVTQAWRAESSRFRRRGATTLRGLDYLRSAGVSTHASPRRSSW